MTTKRYSPECMDRHFIALGKEGEGNHLALRFDTAVWREAYPEAEILLWVTPPVGEGYFAELAEQSGDVIWTVTSGDTEHEGNGEIELILRDKATGTTIKSATARTLIKKSPSHSKGGEPPEAHNPWWEKVLAAIRGVVRSVNGVLPDEDGNIDIEVIGGADEEQVREIVEERLTEAKENGDFKGDKGDKGDQGEQGPAGPKGDKGDKGDQGEQGPAGPAGKDGAQGPEGPQGPVGKDGAQGPAGADGKDGEQGPAGKDGADGKTPVRGTDYWTPTDKTEIVSDVLAALPTWEGGAY